MCERMRLSVAGALRMVDMTIGAPQRWVIWWSASASQIALGLTQRSVTWVPAATEIDHGKHQPLQWNIGRVQR